MKFTKHALIRVEQRRIDEYSIESAINDPDETIGSFGRRKLARKIIDNKILEIVYIGR
jgi:hypothetical protein